MDFQCFFCDYDESWSTHGWSKAYYFGIYANEHTKAAPSGEDAAFSFV